MASLLRPQSFAQDFGTVMARAQQAAVSQSATIISAANNIARARERAGQQATDSLFRMRLEEFQREQFAQKTKVENARLAIAQEENQRAGELFPLQKESAQLSNKLQQLNIDDAPLRRSMLAAQTSGVLLGNAAKANDLQFQPQRLQDEQDFFQTRNKVAASNAELQLGLNDRAVDAVNAQAAVLADLHALASLPPSPERLMQGPETLKRLHQEHRMEIEMDTQLTSAFNDAVERFGMEPHFKIQPSAPVIPTIDGLELSGARATVGPDGKLSVQGEFQDPNDRVKPIDVNRRISAIEDQGRAQTATFSRELKSVNEEIASLNRELAKAKSEDLKERISSKLNERRNHRSTLEGDLRNIEKQVSDAIGGLMRAEPGDEFPGGFPGVSPRGPSTSIIGRAEDVVSIFN